MQIPLFIFLKKIATNQELQKTEKGGKLKSFLTDKWTYALLQSLEWYHNLRLYFAPPSLLAAAGGMALLSKRETIIRLNN